MEEPMTLDQILNSIGKPVWLALMVAGFIWWWPAGIFILAYLAWSGRLGAWVTSKPWVSTFWGSGNAAFDEHRADALATLEKERADFGKFIDDLKKAKDRTEFDQFMKKGRKR
jgi:uncharacterized protein DUF2852